MERNTSGSRPKELFEDVIEDMEAEYEKAKVRLHSTLALIACVQARALASSALACEGASRRLRMKCSTPYNRAPRSPLTYCLCRTDPAQGRGKGG